MKVYWSNLFVYRTNFFLQTIGPLFVFLFIKLSLWTSIYLSSQKSIIGGYTLEEMLAYHLWIMVASMIILTSSSQNLSEDIRLGKISSYLIYPFSFWEFHASNFAARQTVQVFIALLTVFILLILLPTYFSNISFLFFIQGLILSLMAGFFWFSLNYIIGLMAFWLEETWTLTVLTQVVTYFCSGAIIPLELYPLWLKEALFYTPFPYLGFVPVRTFMGESLLFWQSVLVLLGWILLINLISKLIWKKGIHLYTAAGM